MRLDKGVRLISLILALSGFAAAQCGAGYSGSKIVVVPPTMIPSNTTATVPLCFNGAGNCAQNFPLDDLKDAAHGGRIRHTAANFTPGAIVGPADFKLCTLSGTAVPFEVSTYDGTTGATVLWYQFAFSSSALNLIRLYYDNSSVTTSQQSNPWDSHFKLVIHGGDGTTLGLYDSTGNVTTFTNHGITAAAGKIGGAIGYGGSPNYADLGTPLNVGSTVFAEAWTYPTANMSFGRIFDNLASCGACSGITMFLGQSGTNTTPEFICASSGTVNEAFAGPGVPLNKWTYLAGSCDPSGGTKLYVNTVLRATAGVGLGTSAQNMNLGRWSGPASNYYTGRNQEIRISDTLRTADYQTINYNAMFSPNGFATMYDAPVVTGLSSGTTYCMPFDTVPAQVPNTDRSNYRLLVIGLFDFFRTIPNGGYANSQYDITWFSDATCTTPIAFQRQFLDVTTGLGAFRSLASTVSHTTASHVYAKFGDPSVTSDQQNCTSVWTGNIAAYTFGSPSSLVTTDCGSAGLDLAVGQSGTPLATAAPWGAAASIPTSSDSLGNTNGGAWTGAVGYPIGSAAGYLKMCFRVPPKFSTFDICSAGCNIGGYGVANGTGARGFGFLQGSGNSAWGFTSGTAPDPGTEGIMTFTGSGGVLPDAGFHCLAFKYPSGGQRSAATLYYDGIPVSTGLSDPTPTNVLNTGNGEVRVGRDATHGVGQAVGFSIGQMEVSTGAPSDDEVATYAHNELQPWNFVVAGVPVAISSGSGGAGAQLIPGIITENRARPWVWQTPASDYDGGGQVAGKQGY